MTNRILNLYIYCIAGLLLLVGIGGYLCYHFFVAPKKFSMDDIKVTILIPQVETQFVPDANYFKEIATADEGSANVFYSTTKSVWTTSTYTTTASTTSATGANAMLFSMADQYFQVYWKNQRVSPILPLALANVETGSRADHSKTWSALYPSAVLDIDNIATSNVTSVLSSGDKAYSVLTTEYSTNERGPLQMSPTYGTKNTYFNSMMSGNEVDKLSTVDTTAHSTWASRASDKPGDRFYIPDILLRLSSAFTDAISDITRHDYQPKSDIQLCAMLAAYHNASGVWVYSDHSKKIGSWKSGQHAYDLCSLAASDSMIELYKQNIAKNPKHYTISRDTAVSMLEKATGRSWNEFGTNKIVVAYPICATYAYVKMSLLYTGG